MMALYITHARCNYHCVEFKHNKEGGYGTFSRYMEKKHSD